MSHPSRIFTHTLLFFSFLFLATACFEDGTPFRRVSVYGTWKLAGFPGYEEKLVISDSRIGYYSGTVSSDTWPTTNFIAEIVSLEHGTFNSGESTNSTHGYAVIRYLHAENPGWGESNKYNIFRWKDLARSGGTNFLSFSTGTKLVGSYPYSTNVVFDTPEAAESGATAAAGYFSYYSENATNY